MATLRVAAKPEAAQMKAAQISKPGGEFELVERQIPEPGAGEVRVKVQACGICHSDVFTKEGSWPGIKYPRVPGHEVTGIIDEVGVDVSQWKEGLRVGVGWHGGHDNTCRECQRGDFRNCRNLRVPGISYDGGYQQYMVAPVEALVSLPEGLNDVEAAPLLCAGITTYNALRRSGAFPGDLVAVQGIGGLGHLAIQFGNKFGYNALQELGGAQVILALAPSSKAISELFDGLAPNGKMVVIGVDSEPLQITPVQLITGSRTIQGWASGTTADEDDTLRFAELSGVRPMIETYPLEKAAEGYARMMSGKARFRVVLTM
jgi:D-arabinose 1-dehydrogenase-like Zn-dependent alcohol dehydrogenase